jgi:TaqI-like C-terminal specificity domain/Eco57I restriction-modification methylase
LLSQQLNFFDNPSETNSQIDFYSLELDLSEFRGAVFTRPEVVDFILDLVGYRIECPLHKQRILEPSFGNGDFLLRVVERLLKTWRQLPHLQDPVAVIGKAILAVEIHPATFWNTRSTLLTKLGQEGFSTRIATELVDRWLVLGDFLLLDLKNDFDFVVGNPPYVRQEMIPDALMAIYRDRYRTIYDRAGLYIPFIERSLLALQQGGDLGFICADRWMKNRYGKLLRKMIADDFHLKIYVDMVDTPAFQSDVIAYPAITVISRQQPGNTRIARRPRIEARFLGDLADRLRAETLDVTSGNVSELQMVTSKTEPWLLNGLERTAIVRRLEQKFPTLESTGCKVGIGVATGADSVFIGDFDTLDIEEDRKVPLAMTRDIRSGQVKWLGRVVVNPFLENGDLVNLREYPKLNRYLETHKEIVAGRYCARKSPDNWYRTIDRITPSLAQKPKLLIPDIKGEAQVVFEDGKLYPHHNLYYIVAESWDLRALQAVLMSSIVRLFIMTYSTQMRGGYLRFQAQYLRRICIPQWQDVSMELRDELIAAAKSGNLEECDRVTFKLFQLTTDEQTSLSKARSMGFE